MSECDREVSIMRRPCPTRGCCAMGEKIGTVLLGFIMNIICYTKQTIPIQCNTTKGMDSTVMRRITTFRSTTDRIYDGGPIIL